MAAENTAPGDAALVKIWLTSELKAQGKTDRQIAAVTAGKLHRIVRGAYATREPDDHLRLLALATVHPQLMFSGATAAHLYGLGPLTWPAEGRVPHECSRDGGELLRLRSYSVHATRRVRGVPVVTPVQLIVDLAGEPRDALATIVRRQYRGVRGNSLLARELAALTTGRADAVAFLDGIITGTASGLELRGTAAVVSALDGVEVTVQVNEVVRGYRFDLVIEAARVLVESDSFAFHGGADGEKSSDRGFIIDRWKGNMASRWGWTLLRYSDDCVNYARDRMAAEVADVVRYNLRHRRGRRLRRPEESLPTDRPVWTWHPLLM